jgi:AcrR family transcriptional regulator
MPGKDSTPAAAVSSHDRILQSAKQLFAERGYENTSTVNIARLAGTSESQLMKHFGSKEGLLEAIFESGWEQMAFYFRAIHELNSPLEKLLALLDLVMKSLDRDPDLKQLMLLEGRRVRKEGRLVLMTQGYLQFVKVVDGILTEMQHTHSLREGLEPQAVRSALMGMFEGMMRDQVLAKRAGYPANFASADVRRMFSLVVAAFAPGR